MKIRFFLIIVFSLTFPNIINDCHSNCIVSIIMITAIVVIISIVILLPLLLTLSALLLLKLLLLLLLLLLLFYDHCNYYYCSCYHHISFTIIIGIVNVFININNTINVK